MKIYLEPQTDSRGIIRVRDALVRYAPSNIELVDHPSKADLVILHVIGRNEHIGAQARWLSEHNIPYVTIQYCLRSTMNPKCNDWIKIWQSSKLVWSYYDLPMLMDEDGIYNRIFNFYHAPLGSDFEVFKATPNVDRIFTIATCSQDALTESTKEAVTATNLIGRQMFHLGQELRRGKNIICITDITDKELAWWYSQCEFVSGLRRTEGFEQPAVEGLFCGARPVLFDKPHYRQWYEGLAEFIPEGSRESVIDSLIALFKEGARPVTELEIAEAKRRFNWGIIIPRFWERALA